nr:hypothetical protein [Mycobacterium leprae]
MAEAAVSLALLRIGACTSLPMGLAVFDVKQPGVRVCADHGGSG